ncbi:MAG: T9SS type A sorting domain-containing protein [Flavobacteriales bacterium]|nr:T9SS type A sorting domain-containing protein [Flavobacteriales bacterium]MBK8707931.1 T9SS type A sorting domain-containing protein [Flavobacteriales bacterium]
MRHVACLLALLPASAFAVLSVTIQHNDATCWYSDGGAIAIPTGGVPPYTYEWSNGVTDQQIQWVAAGTYSVTVTDSNSDQVMEQVAILSLPYALQGDQGYAYCEVGGVVFPEFPFVVPTEAAAPWYVNGMELQLAPNSQWLYAFYPGTSPYTLSFSDGNGCSGTISGSLGPQITNWPALNVIAVEPSCSNANVGSIRVQSAGPQPNPPWTYINLTDQSGTPVGLSLNLDPQTLQVEFTGLAPGMYGFHWWLGATLENLDPGVCAHDTVWVEVPNLGPVCGFLSGMSWYDVDSDCVQDPNEVGIPYSPLVLEPGGEVVPTGSNGMFNIPLLNGSYTVAQSDPTLINICPLPQPVPFTVNSNLTTINFGNGSTMPLDLRASISSGTSRPGFAVNISATAHNLTPQLSGPVTFTVEVDPLLDFISATPAPTTTNGNSFTWEWPVFNSFEARTVSISAEVPVPTPLGTVLIHSATVSNTLTESSLANNSATIQPIVTGSFDPNDKTASTSTGASNELYFIDQDEWIDYTIRFQNTGTDTAFTVVVTDTLPASLDIASFEMGTASHPFEVYFRTGRVVEWRFPNILLPDSNVNEAASHGLLSFRIKPVQPLLLGTSISNEANIYFDFNEPVITDPSVLVAEFSTGVRDHDRSAQLLIQPNPASDHVRVSLGDERINRMRVLGMDAREMMNFTNPGSPVDLDIKALSPGVYVIEVEGNGRRLREQLVKQ